MNRFKKGDLIYDTYDKFFRIFRVVATKTDRATYEEVRQACIDAIKWQYEQDNPILIKNDK